MPRPVQHPRRAPRGTACNVVCGTLLPLSASRKHVPVSVGAKVHLRPGQEAAERGRGMGQVTLWRGTCSPEHGYDGSIWDLAPISGSVAYFGMATGGNGCAMARGVI
jgi:hypothetical protein